MTSNQTSTTSSEPPAVPSLADGAAKLAAVVECFEASERFLARTVRLLGEVIGSGVCEAVEGLPIDIFLTNVCRLIGSDRATLLTSADVLRDMPQLSRLFEGGEVSWGQVRNICLKASRLSRDHRTSLDGRIGATMDRWGGLDGFHPDELLHEVDVAITELRDPKQVEREERGTPSSSFLAVQPRFDGGMRFLGEADPLETATLLEAWDAGARDRRAGGGPSLLDHHDDNPDVHDDGRRPNRPSRAFDRFQGLLACAENYLAGTSRRPRPSMNVIVDLRDVHVNAAGQLETRLPGCLPSLSARLVELLASDADLRAVVVDGKRPLAVSARQSAAIPAEVRLAVRLRDRGDRFPGSDLPASDAHVHHLVPREHGGSHHPDNLITLGARHHLHHVHRRGWRPALDPDTGLATFERDGRTFRSLPRGTPLEPPNDSGGPDPPDTS
ncbi:MAG: DUF222 domain-containing protein [Nitriliruptorales bacterium]|nr:DUF222 domain-containing protein [Nitriliruptorales bacterium]